jgi:hypothetical protein
MNDPHDNVQTDRAALERYRDTLTHASTIPQPLAWACAAGHCPVIMSDTRPGMEHEGKLIGIHASRRPAADGGASVLAALGWSELPGVFPCGALIGVARLVGVVRPLGRFYNRDDGGPSFGRCVGRGPILALLDQATSKRIEAWWRSGSKWGLLLAEAVLLPEPIPMRGAGGVWRIPECKRWVGGLCVDDPPHHCVPAKRALEQWRKARAT